MNKEILKRQAKAALAARAAGGKYGKGRYTKVRIQFLPVVTTVHVHGKKLTGLALPLTAKGEIAQELWEDGFDATNCFGLQGCSRCDNVVYPEQLSPGPAEYLDYEPGMRVCQPCLTRMLKEAR